MDNFMVKTEILDCLKEISAKTSLIKCTNDRITKNYYANDIELLTKRVDYLLKYVND